MERLVCLALVCVAAALADPILNPRGARPVEHGTRDEKCATQKEWPFCMDVEWGAKCPSGCRIQGLMDKSDHSLQKKIEKVRQLLGQNTVKHRNADQTTKLTFDFLKDKLTLDAGNDDNYFNLAQTLRQRITDMKIKIDRQVGILDALKDRIKDQVVEMQRLEVDIDIKLRSCKGSCAVYNEHQVEKESYVTLDKQVKQLTNQVPKESAGALYVMKSRSLQDAVIDTRYKSKDAAGQQSENMFPGVVTVQLVLESEGSSTTPATVSKDPGTSLNPSTASSTSSSTRSSSNTELGGSDISGLTHTSTSTITCTTRTRTIVENTSNGPVERTENVVEGGAGCQAMPAGGLDSLFPGLSTSTRSSSSSSVTSSHYSGGTKGLLFDTKTSFDPFGSDLGGAEFGLFMAGAGEDDNPNLQARSVNSARVERQADYVGQVCSRLLSRQNLIGQQSSAYAKTNNGRRCRVQSDVPLCSDVDWVSKCPSGCRVQGMISQMESKVEAKMRMVCKKAKKYEDVAEKTMKTMTHVYDHNRRVIVDRYTSELKFVEHSRGLARNLTSLRRKSSRLSRQLQELIHRVQRQVQELYRMEVDIDMKLRTCHGSCKAVVPFTVSHHSYETLQTDMRQLGKGQKKRKAAAVPLRDIPHINLRPVDMGRVSSADYKTIPTVQRELLTQFEDIGQNRIFLEELLTESEGVEADPPSELE